MNAHDRLKAERDAVRGSFGYRQNELNWKSNPMTPEELVARDVRKYAEQDAALDALIEKAIAIGVVDGIARCEREAGKIDNLMEIALAATGNKEVM